MNAVESNINNIVKNIQFFDLAVLMGRLIYPTHNRELELPKNYDNDPITFEEEVDLKKSQENFVNGNIARFSPDTPREEILKHLGLL